jgi:hypothetical protein
MMATQWVERCKVFYYETELKFKLTVGRIAESERRSHPSSNSIEWGEKRSTMYAKLRPGENVAAARAVLKALQVCSFSGYNLMQ